VNVDCVIINPDILSHTNGLIKYSIHSRHLFLAPDNLPVFS